MTVGFPLRTQPVCELPRAGAASLVMVNASYGISPLAGPTWRAPRSHHDMALEPCAEPIPLGAGTSSRQTLRTRLRCTLPRPTPSSIRRCGRVSPPSVTTLGDAVHGFADSSRDARGPNVRAACRGLVPSTKHPPRRVGVGGESDNHLLVSLGSEVRGHRPGRKRSR